MLFDVDGAQAEVRAFLNRVIEITGFPMWKQREQEFARQLQSNPLLRGYLDTQFPIEMAMLAVRRHIQSTGRIPEIINAPRNDIGALYAFVGMTARVFSRLPQAGQHLLRSRMVGALKDNVGLAPLAFEMRTAAHFMAKGFDVEFVDLCGEARFDFLVRKSDIEMEVECKCVSGDLGHQIHLLHQYQLGPYLWPTMKAYEKDGTVQVLIATLPGRLHGQTELMKAVGATITKALTERADFTGSGPCSVRYREFPITGSPFAQPSAARITEDEVLNYCHRLLGEDVGRIMTTYRPAKGATVVALRSEAPDEFLKGVSRNIKEAASKQLSRSRPGVICVQFRNMTSTQLQAVAGEPTRTEKPTAIQLMTADFFDNPARSHVHTLSYVAPGKYVQRRVQFPDTETTDIIRRTIVSEDAVSYSFTNKKNPHVDDRRYYCF